MCSQSISKHDLWAHYEQHSIPATQTLDKGLVKDVMGAILHAILFHRLFGSVHPRTFEVLDVTFVSSLLTDSTSACTTYC